MPSHATPVHACEPTAEPTSASTLPVIPITWSPSRWPSALTLPTTTPPDLPSTPGAFLRAVTHLSLPAIGVGVTVSTVLFLSQALTPLALGHLLDSGLEHGLTSSLVPSLIALIGLGIVGALTSGIEDASAMGAWTSAWKASMRGSAHRLGLRPRAVTQEVASGDVVATITNDADRVGELMYLLVTVIGALLSVVVVGVLMLRTSAGLGLLVLLGLPVVLALVAAFIRPLDKHLSVQREEQGNLSTITTDAVSGLRVLRGIGGEDVYGARYAEVSGRVRDAGVRVALTQAVLAAIKVGAPMLFTAVVVGAGASAAVRGTITPGQLVTFYGYTTFLMRPLGIMADLIQTSTRAWVGARKISRLQGVEALTSDALLDPAAALDGGGDLLDTTSGVRLRAGSMTALVCADPDTSARLAERLGRYEDASAPVLLGGTDLRAVSVEEVRRTVLVCGAHAEVFAGSLGEEVLGDEVPLAPARELADVVRTSGGVGAGDGEPVSGGLVEISDSQRQRAERALEVAAAADAVDSLGGLEGVLTEKARNVSGGQRQRLALARAVARRAPVLVLVEPTSALDSHTEDLVAQRLRAEREGLTTVVVTASPLLLGRCDEVVLLGVTETGGAPGGGPGGEGEVQVRELARGTHHEMSTSVSAYRAVVERAAHGDDTQEGVR